MARILIVEDEPVIAFDLKMSLVNLEHQVCGIAYFGEDAIKMSEEQNPDLVLMDIKLSEEMDGIEAAEKIQNDFNIPVIFVTAYADKDTIERVKKVNPYGYFLKPYDDKELQVNLSLALSKLKPNENLNQEKICTRSFEFPERFYLAGLTMLCFLSQILKSYFPSTPFKINLIQEKSSVRLILENRRIEKDLINKLLRKFGNLIQDQISPDKFFQKKKDINLYYQQTEIIKLQIERNLKTKESGSKYKNLNEEIKSDLKWLKNHIGIILKYPENNFNGLEGITIDSIRTYQIRDNNLIESVKNLRNRLENGLYENDEDKIKADLRYISNKSHDIYSKLHSFVYGLIINGVIKGISANLIYKWMNEI